MTTATRRSLGPIDGLVLSTWCGPAGGLLEVAARVVLKALPGHRTHEMIRHLFWMVPLSNLLILCGIGLPWAHLDRMRPSPGMSPHPRVRR